MKEGLFIGFYIADFIKNIMKYINYKFETLKYIEVLKRI